MRLGETGKYKMKNKKYKTTTEGNIYLAILFRLAELCETIT